jgi:uracil-DNA glycosylase
MTIPIGASGKKRLSKNLNGPAFQKLFSLIEQAYQEKIVFPPQADIFNAFRLCSFDSVRVVILGQDPYHGQGQAHGLAFSVPDHVPIPPSLKNIFKELSADLGISVPHSGNLEHWAKQGVLLLNTTLTVEKQKPGSHHHLGWETFTDTVIKTISDEKEHVVFLLWGNFARAKKSLIDAKKHLILEAPHPSPFSARTGFFGCRHFTATNDFLTQHHTTPINW